MKHFHNNGQLANSPVLFSTFLSYIAVVHHAGTWAVRVRYVNGDEGSVIGPATYCKYNMASLTEGWNTRASG